jgi:hypothetical protein
VKGTVVSSLCSASMAIYPRSLGVPPPSKMVFTLDEKLMNLWRAFAVKRGNRVGCRCFRGDPPSAENGPHTENSRFLALWKVHNREVFRQGRSRSVTRREC